MTGIFKAGFPTASARKRPNGSKTLEREQHEKVEKLAERSCSSVGVRSVCYFGPFFEMVGHLGRAWASCRLSSWPSPPADLLDATAAARAGPIIHTRGHPINGEGRDGGEDARVGCKRKAS